MTLEMMSLPLSLEDPRVAHQHDYATSGVTSEKAL